MIENDAIRVFHRNLHQWYNAHGRKDLPWRNTRDPYAIYISEIMLQQTQVKTVLERYYFQFLSRFPTLSALASAKQTEILSAWQGLGYYNRALNLHETARRCGNQLPGDVESLMALPGIGRNTAHAVAAFAFRQPVAVMEANVRRVLSRIFALQNPSEPELWEKAGQLLDKNHPFDYNQAMMDIGATICKKRAPLCHSCPAETICQGKTAPELYPAAKTIKSPPVREKRIVVLQSGDRYYASPRRTRFLNGLHHFIEIDADTTHIALNNREYALDKPLGHIRQQYSHFTLSAEVFLLVVPLLTGKNWHSRAAMLKLPVSMAERKIMTLLDDSMLTK